MADLISFCIITSGPDFGGMIIREMIWKERLAKRRFIATLQYLLTGGIWPRISGSNLSNAAADSERCRSLVSLERMSTSKDTALSSVPHDKRVQDVIILMRGCLLSNEADMSAIANIRIRRHYSGVLAVRGLSLASQLLVQT
jgi:hypothetical protein